jgi:2-phosphosulfolactate phosphatase
LESVPRIRRMSLLSGARQAEGISVVIDVLRAFTCAAYMANLGADKILLVAEPDKVLQLKRENGYLAVGEVDGIPVPGFDLGNSPTQIQAAGQAFFKGRTVALRTSAGVTGAVAAAHRSDLVLLGSYVTARAIARYIKNLSPQPRVVSLVAMGSAGLETTPEDERCADYLEQLLTGRPYDHAIALREIVEHEATQKFLRNDQGHYPPADPIYCLQRDLFDLVLVARLEEGQLVTHKTDAPQEQTT